MSDAVSIVVCGQSNARGQWRNSSDTEPFPLGHSWPGSWLCQNPTTPNAQEPTVQGNAMWPYVSQLLARRHAQRAMFWNCAVGSTGLSRNWNGTTVLRAADAGVGALTTNGTSLTSATGGLDAFSDGEQIRVRNCGANDGAYTVVGAPGAASLTVTPAFPVASAYTTGTVHGAFVGTASGAFDPNGHYAAAADALARGNFSARYVLLQIGNNDFNSKLTQSDIETELQTFVDFFVAAGATGVLLGGTTLGTTESGTVFTNGIKFMRDAWLPACRTIVGSNALAHMGAHLGEAVAWAPDGFYKSDNIHINYEMHYIAAEAWYRAIATVLGLALSSAGRAYAAIGSGELLYPVTRIA